MKVRNLSEKSLRWNFFLLAQPIEPNGFIIKEYFICISVQLIYFIIFRFLSLGSLLVQCLPLPGKSIKWTRHFLLVGI